MFKKIGLAAVLSTSLIFGGALTASADSVNDSSPTVSYKTFIYQLENGKWKEMNGNRFSEFIKTCLPSYNKRQEEKNDSKVEKDTNEQDSNKVEVNENQDKDQVKEEVEQPNTETTEEQPSEETVIPEENVEKPTENNQSQNQYQLSQYEQEVVDLTNQEREKQGLSALKVDWELSRVAREKSNDMAVNGYFSHNSPVYGSPFDMMKNYGISYRAAGENIARGQQSPQEVVTGWMNSEGHRANILNGDFTHIGVGYVENGNHWTQQFIGK